MIRTLPLENYRGFERYELRGLTKVNLLVGPNNCGKTSVLEAVRHLVARGDPRMLRESASRRAESSVADPRGNRPPVQFLSAESPHPREMASAWDEVTRLGREAEGVAVMRLIQPDLRSIHSPAGEPTRNGGGSDDILLGFQPGAHRVPIGEHGDGMRRLLSLSLSLVRAAEGFLLIDEIERGLHWTVMEGMWGLVVDVAGRSSVQVFATTHSLDCIVGLAALLKKRPDLADAVSVQKIERRLDHSVGFDGADIATATDLGIELR